MTQTTLRDKKLLPNERGVYFVVRDGEIIYIGQSKNVKIRWRGHHKLTVLKPTDLILFIPLLDLQDSELKQTESRLIKHFKPVLNGPPASYQIRELDSEEIRIAILSLCRGVSVQNSVISNSNESSLVYNYSLEIQNALKRHDMKLKRRIL